MKGPTATCDMSVRGAQSQKAQPAMHEGDGRRKVLTGDGRANWNILLLSIHTIFARQHNRLCGELRKELWKGHPLLDHLKQGDEREKEEELYQLARDANIIIYQRIAKHQYAPGYASPEIAKHFEIKQFYPHEADKINIPNHFSILYRLHSLAPTKLIVQEPYYDTNKDHIGGGDALSPAEWINNARSRETKDASGRVGTKTYSLLDTFMNPQQLRDRGLAAVLGGMALTNAKTMGVSVVDELRKVEVKDREGTVFPHDLVAMDVMRGRERVLPVYREVCESHARWWASRLRPSWKETNLWHEKRVYGLLFQVSAVGGV